MEHTRHAMKMGSLLGIIAAITVILFGKWSGAVIGSIIGAAAGFLVAREANYSPRQAAALGRTAGFFAGLVTLIGTVLEAWVILPLAGKDPMSLVETLKFGVGALVMATLGGILMGSLQGLGPERVKASKIAFVVFLLIFPWVDHFTALDWVSQVIYILIFTMLALGLNIVVGYAGLLDLGYAAFFAIGAYTTGFLSSPQLSFGWNFWIVIWIAAGVAALAGVILGTPTLPLIGDYLAIVTLGFGEIVPILFRNLTSVRIDEPISKMIAGFTGNPDLAICWIGCIKPLNITNGEAGINPIGRPWLPGIGTFESGQYLPWYYLILGLVALAVFAISRLRYSRLGRAWNAMREDELAASTMGINLVQTRLLAFAMGATFSGFAGSFYAAYISAIFPSVFDFSISVIILCMVILGGLGNMAGVMLGCTIIMGSDRLFLPQLAQVLKDILKTSVLPNISDPGLRDTISVTVDPIQMRLLLFGLVLVIMMLVRPEGLIPSARHRAELRGGDPKDTAGAEALTQTPSV